LSIRFEDSYHGQLRAAVGNRRLILPSCRAIIRNDTGNVLLVRRSDNAEWVMPAGSLELGESVMDCLCREVREESGLHVREATLIAVYSEPRFAFTNAYGGEHQMLALVFRVDAWDGTLRTASDETVDARFFPRDALPEMHARYHETLADLDRFAGHPFIK
jgi:ADP-ribose pyrophosphatase YjhB (NUDIX family)